MARKKWQTGLLAIRNAAAAEIEALKEKVAVGKSRRETLQQEIEARRVKLAQLGEQVAVYTEQLRELEESQALQEEAAAALAVLAQGYDLLQERLQEIRQLNQQRRALEAEHGSLRKLYAEYQEADSLLADMRKFPDSYQQRLLAHHQELKEKLVPFVRWQKKQKALVAQSLTLPVLLVSDRKEAQIIWLLPVPARDVEHPEDMGTALRSFIKSTVDALLRIHSHPDWFMAGWHVADASSTQAWHGYYAIVSLIEYEGKGEMVGQAQALVNQYLAELLDGDSLFGRYPYQIELVDFSLPAWEYARKHQSPTAASPHEIPAPEAVVPLAERSQGWYTDEDMVTWERTLNVTADSTWNEQGRRLRTMFINLVAKGKVGGDTVDANLLWQPLPAPHAEAVKAGIEKLVAEGVLHRPQPDRVTVNSAMLGQVQGLINRDLSDFWHPILAAHNLKSDKQVVT